MQALTGFGVITLPDSTSTNLFSGGAFTTVVAGGITVITGISTETNSAFSVQPLKIYSVGQSQETNSAFALSITKTVNIGISQESDTAFDITANRTYLLNLANETDSANNVAPIKFVGISVGLSAEIDLPFGMTIAKSFGIGIAYETNTAQSVIFPGSGLRFTAGNKIAINGRPFNRIEVN